MDDLDLDWDGQQQATLSTPRTTQSNCASAASEYLCVFGISASLREPPLRTAVTDGYRRIFRGLRGPADTNMWGLSSVSFMKDSDFKYDAIPSAEIEDRDYLSNNEYLEDKDSFVDIPHRPTVRRTPFQNCLLFSSPLVLLMVVTWVLVSISSTDREVSIVKSLKASKAAAKVTTTTSTSTAGDGPPV
eukprot:gene13936-16204_t